MAMILFWVFAAIAVAGAVNLLIQRHPIHSALSLVVVMGALAVEYLLLGAEFIAFIQMIVYAGAIMVLFVFVIMVLNAGEVEGQARSRMAAWVGLPVLVLLALVVIGQSSGAFHSSAALGEYMVQTGPVGASLFHNYLLPFEVTSVLFLVGVLGAVVLAARRDQVDTEESVPKETAEAAAAGARR